MMLFRVIEISRSYRRPYPRIGNIPYIARS